MTKKEPKFLDYLLVLIKWKKFIFLNLFIVGILAIILSLLLPKKYKATVLFLPPSRNSGLSSLIQNFSIDPLGNSDITGEVCLSILDSRELREHIINTYDLMERYDTKYIEHTLKKLDNYVIIETDMEVSIGRSSIISIAINVIDKSPQIAANMANDFFHLLEERIIQLNTQKAHNHRIFLGNRVQKNLTKLRIAEDSLSAFQKRYGAIEITEQAKAAIEVASRLKAELLAAEIKKETLLPVLNVNHAEIKQIENQIEALKKKYAELHTSSNQFPNGTADIFIPIEKIPSIGLGYYRLLREVEIQNKLQEMLVPLLEQARIQEAKTIPILRVIDRAVPPTYKYSPKRAYIVIGIVAVSFAFCLLYVFIREYLERVKDEDEEEYKKIMSILGMFQIRRKARTRDAI